MTWGKHRVTVRASNYQHGVISATSTGPQASSTPARAELCIGMLLIVVAHTCDAVSTYISSPDLAREMNPIYLKLAGLGYGGWPTLLTLKGTGVIVSLGLFAYYLRNRRHFYPESPGASFQDFLHFTHGKDAVRRKDGRWLAPSTKLLGLWTAFTISVGSAAYAYCLAIGNLLLTPILTPVMLQIADVVAPAAVFMLTAVVFWRTLFEDYRRAVRE